MKYPSIPHLSFSPEIHREDKALSEKETARLLSNPIIVTEKLDGGNCCLHNGKVYARTHSAEAKHWAQ